MKWFYYYCSPIPLFLQTFDKHLHAAVHPLPDLLQRQFLREQSVLQLHPRELCCLAEAPALSPAGKLKLNALLIGYN